MEPDDILVKMLRPRYPARYAEHGMDTIAPAVAGGRYLVASLAHRSSPGASVLDASLMLNLAAHQVPSIKGTTGTYNINGTIAISNAILGATGARLHHRPLELATTRIATSASMTPSDKRHTTKHHTLVHHTNIDKDTPHLIPR